MTIRGYVGQGTAWNSTLRWRVEPGVDGCWTIQAEERLLPTATALLLVARFDDDALVQRDPASVLATLRETWRAWRRILRGGRTAAATSGWRNDAERGLARHIPRQVSYLIGCAAPRLADGTQPLLTDHRILPLSWSRDAYYGALFLLLYGRRVLATASSETAGGTSIPDPEKVVAGHLLWLWWTAERSDGLWGRAYLPSGCLKDRAFQLDQQLYPILELADYVASTGNLPGVALDRDGAAKWLRSLFEVWEALSWRKLDSRWLIGSEENAADDRTLWPFTLAGHLLLWKAAVESERLTRTLTPYLGDPAGSIDLLDPRKHTRDRGLYEPAERFHAWAAAIRADIERTFAAPGPFGPQWAAEADGRGHHLLYHDANDFPTALAPAWGFCAPEAERWRNTMRFAFSSENPAYFPGTWGGLGSLHTPAPWPLGDAQRWIAARVQSDLHTEERVARRLLALASADGMWPEAYDAETGRWVSRHWFAWPGSVVHLLLLGWPIAAETRGHKTM